MTRSCPSAIVTLSVVLIAIATSAQEPDARSAGARSPDRVEIYKTIGDVKLPIEIYLPPDHKPTDHRPAIVFFFGGGWSNGTTKQFAHQCAYLASRGMVALAADYRVYNRQQAQVVDCVADAKSAIRWTRQNAARLGIDPDKIVSAGGSAGGHLAAAVGTINGFEQAGEDISVSSRPNAMALFNPALDLRAEAFPPERQKKREGGFESRMGAKPESLSPALQAAAGAPPAIVFHGEADSTVPFAQAQQFTERMKAAGNRCELVSYPGKGHGFFNFGRDGNQSFANSLRHLDAFLVGLNYLQAGEKVEAYLEQVPSKAAPKAADGAYFPPPESRGGWRTLVTANEAPSAEQKARIRELAGLDWDGLHEAWKYCAGFGGRSSVVVIRHGWLAGEWFNYDTPHGIASCTKSLTALSTAKLCELSAAGEFKKKIDFDSPAWKYLPASWSEQDPRRKAIALRHMLTMSSGLDPYDGPYRDLDAYGQTILTQQVEAPPGTVWAYASAPVDLLSLVVEDVSGKLLSDFFNEQIAAPIGAAPVQFPQFGTHSGGSGGPGGGARLATRDHARLGYLLLHEGEWRDESGTKQVLTPETVRLLTAWEPRLESETYREPNFARIKGAQNFYGYLFWTNRTQESLGTATPADAFYMSGWGKQICCVIPSLDLVFVRVGSNAELNSHPEYYPELLSRVVASVVEK
ncbi:MAG: serine hydrolase [Planctomycetes bacterium]|nr:serine hydrolase [Planctomycetota bacterium]